MTFTCMYVYTLFILYITWHIWYTRPRCNYRDVNENNMIIGRVFAAIAKRPQIDTHERAIIYYLFAVIY